MLGLQFSALAGTWCGETAALSRLTAGGSESSVPITCFANVTTFNRTQNHIPESDHQKVSALHVGPSILRLLTTLDPASTILPFVFSILGFEKNRFL
jgi:hypothetical protein